MTSVALGVRVALLREHGTFPQAYSATFQDGLSHFGDERGFVAYKSVGRTSLVLGDPVAAQADWTDLISRFLAAHPDAGFWQVSREMVQMLAPRGFFINEMGPDIRLDLAHYNLVGRKKQNLRSAVNQAARLGYVTREALLTSVDIKEVASLSEEWRRTRTIGGREVSFLNRPLVLADEPDVRKFFMFDETGKIVAFCGFDPIFERGAVVGYVAQHNRHRPEVASFADYAIKSCAIEAFQAEGKKWLFLGLAPFAYINDWEFLPYKNWLVRRSFVFAYTNTLFNRFVYPLKGHEAHKRQFRGVPQQTYYCFNTLPSLPRLIKVLRACDIF
jgi:lysylphosphatidylglycerol synthetase-like protein (DUF2156 family)